MDKKAKTGIVLGVMCLALTLGICIQIRTVKQYSTKVGQNYDQNNLRAEVLKYKEKYENQIKEIEKIKSDEQDKNLADKQKEEENIQIKEAEKRRLQDILNN